MPYYPGIAQDRISAIDVLESSINAQPPIQPQNLTKKTCLSMFEIGIEDDKRIFLPGQPVDGQLSISLKASAYIRILRIRFTGFISTHYLNVYSNKKDKLENLGIATIFKELQTCVGSADVSKEPVLLAEGDYVYPFSFRLPALALPPTYTGLFGSVKYEIGAVYLEKDSEIETTLLSITVPSTLDAASTQYNEIPQEICIKNIGMWWWSKGDVILKAEIPRKDMIPLTIEIINQANCTIELVGVCLKQKCSTKSNDEKRGPKTEKIHKLEFSETYLPTLKNIKRLIQFPIPSSQIISPTIKTAILNVTHFLEVKLKATYDPSNIFKQSKKNLKKKDEEIGVGGMVGEPFGTNVSSSEGSIFEFLPRVSSLPVTMTEEIGMVNADVDCAVSSIIPSVDITSDLEITSGLDVSGLLPDNIGESSSSSKPILNKSFDYKEFWTDLDISGISFEKKKNLSMISRRKSSSIIDDIKKNSLFDVKGKKSFSIPPSNLKKRNSLSRLESFQSIDYFTGIKEDSRTTRSHSLSSSTIESESEQKTHTPLISIQDVSNTININSTTQSIETSLLQDQINHIQQQQHVQNSYKTQISHFLNHPAASSISSPSSNAAENELFYLPKKLKQKNNNNGQLRKSNSMIKLPLLTRYMKVKIKIVIGGFPHALMDMGLHNEIETLPLYFEGDGDDDVC